MSRWKPFGRKRTELAIMAATVTFFLVGGMLAFVLELVERAGWHLSLPILLSTMFIPLAAAFAVGWRIQATRAEVRSMRGLCPAARRAA